MIRYKGLLSFLCALVIVLGGVFIYKKESDRLKKEAGKVFTETIHLDTDRRVVNSGLRVIWGAADKEELSDKAYIENADGKRAIDKDWSQESVSVKKLMGLQTLLYLSGYYIEVDSLNTLFVAQLNENKMVAETAVRYRDKKKKEVADTETNPGFYEMAYPLKELFLGLEEEMSVQAFVKFSPLFILCSMWKELILLALTCVAFGIGLYGLIKYRKGRVVEVSKFVLVKDTEIEQSQVTDTYLRISGNILFCPAKKQVFYCDTQVISLTDTSAHLLFYMLESPGYFISNADMEKKLRGNIIDSPSWCKQNIKRLRDALKPIPEIRIENIRGEGYKLCCEPSV